MDKSLSFVHFVLYLAVASTVMTSYGQRDGNCCVNELIPDTKADLFPNLYSFSMKTKIYVVHPQPSSIAPCSGIGAWSLSNTVVDWRKDAEIL